LGVGGAGDGAGGRRGDLRAGGGREEAGSERSSEEGLEERSAGHGSIFRFSRWRGKLFVYV
jgi:hypothetical protein